MPAFNGRISRERFYRISRKKASKNSTVSQDFSNDNNINRNIQFNTQDDMYQIFTEIEGSSDGYVSYRHGTGRLASVYKRHENIDNIILRPGITVLQISQLLNNICECFERRQRIVSAWTCKNKTRSASCNSF